MKTLLIQLAIFTFILASFGCNSVNGEENNKKEALSSEKIVKVYYFHYTRRCATCLAVENETQDILNDLYNGQIENKQIIFQSVNLDEDGSKELAEELEISGQTLIIVAGENKENITTDAFMNARSNPEKLKEIIKSTIDALLDL